MTRTSKIPDTLIDDNAVRCANVTLVRLMIITPSAYALNRVRLLTSLITMISFI
jgi:hypothetical protein